MINRAMVNSVIVALVLAGCGGGGSDGTTGGAGGGSGGGAGGGGDGAGSFDVSPTSLSFEAPMPGAAQPLGQKLTGTVTGDLSGTLYIIVNVAGEAVASVSDFDITSATTGEGFVRVHPPQDLGPGTFEDVLTVRACLDDPTCQTGELSGSPRTVSVSYTIGNNVQMDVVAPRVVVASEPGEVILRGEGFESVANVSFGGNDGQFTIVSDSEIHADYPGLTAGTYDVSLNGGSIPFSGSLVAVDAPSFAAATLDFPEPLASGALRALVYDAERAALVVAVSYAQPGSNQVLRYVHTGAGWSAPAVASVPDLRGLALTRDGSRILATSDNGMTELDAATLTSTGTYAGPFESEPYYLTDIVVANDGNAIVTTDIHGSGTTDAFLYSPMTHTFVRAYGRLYRGTPNVSLDGSRVVMIQGSLSPPPAVEHYLASSGRFEESSVRFNQGRLAVDGDADRIVLAGTNPFASTEINVYDGDYQSLGTLGATARAVALAADGSSAYVLDGNELLTFDLTAEPVGGSFPQVDNVTVPDPGIDTDDRVELVVTPDGGTAFLAGSARIVVQPLQ